MTLPCTVEGCEKPRFGHGWCSGHYTRWRRHGSPTAGRTPRGIAAKYLFETVLPFNEGKCLIWPYDRINGSRSRICWDGRSYIASRLVCELTYGLPPSREHVAAHSCGNGRLGCVNPHHLRWATPRENSQDAIGHGTTQRGEKHKKSKLTAKDVRAIRAIGKSKSLKEIAREFGVCFQLVHLIQKRKVWTWLDDEALGIDTETARLMATETMPRKDAKP